MSSETQTEPDSAPRPRGMRPGAIVWMLIGACCLVELTLTLADFGVIGSVRWRSLAYQNGAFWAGLLHNWRPNYALQPYTMFLSYAFLHGGISHLAGNMVLLFLLGPLVRERMGRGAFVAIYAASVVGGGAGYAFLGNSVQPVVGASGALFGLVGALVYRDWADRRQQARALWPVMRTIGLLVAANFATWWMLDQVLAWETHLAGFVTGWLVAWLFGMLK